MQGREGGGWVQQQVFFSEMSNSSNLFSAYQKKTLKYSTHIGRNNFEQFKGQYGNVGSILMSLIPHTTVIFSY